jgi:hypothetical protein
VAFRKVLTMYQISDPDKDQMVTKENNKGGKMGEL